MSLPAQSPAKAQNKINRVETREKENQFVRKLVCRVSGKSGHQEKQSQPDILTT
jgi:hypothetical protein